jgi:hypothetical protein
MATAEAQVVAKSERRRSERSPLALPLVVRGDSLDAKPFQEQTFTLSVSAHGALVALTTTVTLGQIVFLKNPQTQTEIGAWVTRLGLPGRVWVQVGLELVRPDGDFWSGKPRAEPPTDSAERQPEEHVLENFDAKGLPQNVPSNGSEEKLQSLVTAPEMRPQTTVASPDTLLQALDQTLRQAAEQAVTEAATARLGALVNQAAMAIDNFARVRTRQLEERFLQYLPELVTLASKDLLAQVQRDFACSEENLRKHTEEFIDEIASKARGDLTERLREMENQAVAHFVESTETSSAAQLARLAEQIEAATRQARVQVEATASESEERTKVELERAVAAAKQRVESLSLQTTEICAEWEARLGAIQKELTYSNEEQVERFRERLRGVLKTLLGPLE